MFQFVFPETGEPAHLYNRLLNAPFDSVDSAVEKFNQQWSGCESLPVNKKSDHAAFMRPETGEIVVLREVG